MDSVIEVLTPDEIIVMWRINAIISDNRSLDMLGKEEQVAMQVLSKRMGSINNQTNAVLTTTGNHLWHLHASRQMDAMHQFYLLPVAASRIIIGGASLLQHLHSLTALRRSSEYQYHAKMRFWNKII